jgi:glycosyltransferase involved in cell wall biosynthesis
VRIVFVADAPYVHTRRWVEHFAARGDDCAVISFRPARIEGARVLHVGGLEAAGKLRYLLQARRVARLVRDASPDLLHALHVTSFGFLAALAGVHPFLLSVEGLDVLEAPRRSPFHAWLTRFSLRRADHVTASSLHLAALAARLAPPAKPVTVVPYGVDLERFQPRARAADGPVVIGAASRLSPEKGVPVLVEALARLSTSVPDLRLRIAGEGPERRRVEALVARRGLAASVELLGEVPHQEMPAFLASLDVFVLPSLREGFGVAAVEAAAAGLPVVASAADGIPDAVEDEATGLLVPPGDPAALADALRRLAGDPALRARLGAAGREVAARRYDWRLNAALMEAVYDGLVARPRREATAT